MFSLKYVINKIQGLSETSFMTEWPNHILDGERWEKEILANRSSCSGKTKSGLKVWLIFRLTFHFTRINNTFVGTENESKSTNFKSKLERSLQQQQHQISKMSDAPRWDLILRHHNSLKTQESEKEEESETETEVERNENFATNGDYSQLFSNFLTYK